MGNVLKVVRNVVAVQSCRDLADHELLQRYVAAQDESAFAALVKRHGSMVMGLCWRILRYQQDAEDAFQAAFLVFARKAGTIRKIESIASWLHSVAFRAANKLRASQARRKARCQTCTHDKGKPSARMGRKAMDSARQSTGLPGYRMEWSTRSA